MQKSNNSKYLLVSALFVFASTKKVYAETEINEESNIPLQTGQHFEQEDLNSKRQKELLKELLSIPTKEELQEELHAPISIVTQTITEDAPITQDTAEHAPSVTTSNELTDKQEELFNNLVNSLSQEEQEQFIELLEEAALIAENSQAPEEQEEQVKTLLERIDTSRCVGFCIKLAIAILCWEIVQPHRLVDENPWLPRSCPEIFKIVTGVLLVDDLKDFIKEFKKSTESEVKLLYKRFFSTQENI